MMLQLLGRSRQLQKLPHHKVIGKDRTALIDLCFNHLDADGSGEIDIEELKVFAKIVNPRAQIQQAEMELQKMDANMDGTINPSCAAKPYLFAALPLFLLPLAFVSILHHGLSLRLLVGWGWHSRLEFHIGLHSAWGNMDDEQLKHGVLEVLAAANDFHSLPTVAMKLQRVFKVGLHAAIKPLLRHSTTGEFNSPPKYVRTLKKCPEFRLYNTPCCLRWITVSMYYATPFVVR
eukprot:1183893-Prorocentrum_minimum.AAC.4